MKKVRNNDKPVKWKGYTFDELEEQILLTDARIMAQKVALRNKVEWIKTGKFIPGLGGKLFSALSYADYAVVGITAIRKLIKLFKSIKGKKS